MYTAKINEKIVFVKTYYVPLGVEFRYKKEWWRKRNDRDAVSVESKVKFVTFPYGTIVAMYKKDLPKCDYVGILKEL